MAIKNILLFYKEKYGLDIDEATIAAFAEHLEKETQGRPMPGFDDIIVSEKAAEIFKTLLEKLQAVQKASQEKPASLEQIATEALTQLDQEGFEKAKNFLQKNREFINLIGYANKLKLTRCDNPEQLRIFLNEIKEKTFSIDYTSVFDISAKNDLAKCALEIHSEICKQSLESSNSPAKFIHFYEQPSFDKKSFRGQPRASEYLQAYGSEEESAANVDFNKTAHGIGSGIYGVANLSAKMIAEQIDERSSQFCIIETKCPLRLSEEASDQYTEISKQLQKIGNLVKEEQTLAWRNGVKLSRKEALDIVVERNQAKLMEFATTINSFESIRSRKFTDQEIYTFLYSSLGDFLEAARSKHNTENIVPMPINYLVDRLGFTGVVSQINDMFSRGLIAMHFSDDSELNTFTRIPVKSSDQRKHSSPNAEDSHAEDADVLTSNTPLPTGVTMGGHYLFFSPQSQAPSVNDDIAAQENTSDKSKSPS